MRKALACQKMTLSLSIGFGRQPSKETQSLNSALG
jgi:hypothetical protein